MRVVYDTNILVLSQIGDPALAILQAAFTDALEKPLTFCYTEAMFTEYTNTLTQLTQTRFNIFDPADIADLLNQVRRYGLAYYYPTISLDVCSHEPDNRFLECAVEAQADYIVTVNTRHFPKTYQGIETVSPQQFYNILFLD